MNQFKQFRNEVLDDYDFSEVSDDYREGYDDGVSDAFHKGFEKKPLAFIGGAFFGLILMTAVVLGLLALFGVLAGLGTIL